MFDGSVRKRAAVSLRGASKKEEKGEFLHKAAADRERRENERRRNAASVTIQRVARGRFAAAHFRSSLRSDFSKKLSDTNKVRIALASQGIVSFSLPARVLIGMLNQALNFIDPSVPGDAKLYLEFSPMLLSGIRLPCPQQNSLFPEGAESNIELQARWHLFTKLFRLNVSILLFKEINCLPDLIDTTPIIDFFQPSLLNPLSTQYPDQMKHFQLVMMSPADSMKCSGSSSRNSMLSSATIPKLMGVIWKKKRNLGNQTSLLSHLWGWCISALGFSEIIGDSKISPCLEPLKFFGVAHFSLVVLTVPNLKNALGQLDSTQHLSGLQWGAVVGSLDLPMMESGGLKVTINDAAIVLRNILDLIGKDRAVTSPSVIKALHSLVGRLPMHVMADSLFHNLQLEESYTNDDNEEEDDITHEQDVSDLNSLVRRELRRQKQSFQNSTTAEQRLSADERTAVYSCFAALMDSSMVSAFFDMVLSVGVSHCNVADEMDPVLSLCGLYGNLIMYDKDNLTGELVAKMMSGIGVRAQVLNTLALAWPHNPVVRRLWFHLSLNYDLNAFASQKKWYLRSKGNSGLVESALGQAVYLLCVVYSHQLLALSDEDFFDHQQPLPVETVRDLVRFLKALLAQMLWEQPVAIGTSKSSHTDEEMLESIFLMHAATRVFNQLYERNLRRPFCHPEEWYWHHLHDKELLPAPAEGNTELADPQQWEHVYSTGKIALVLNNIPQVIPFTKRVQIFRRLLAGEKARAQQQVQAENDVNPMGMFFHSQGTRMKVRRAFLYEDSYAALANIGNKLKGRIQVTFENEHGVEEAGIDGGGVFKEFMDAITKRTFDPQYALFRVTQDQLLFPNPASYLALEDHLRHFEFAGQILGKALFEDILVETQFANFFLNTLLGKHNQFDDLFSLDAELYKNLNSLKEMAACGEDISNLCLYFSITTSEYGQNKTINLISEGENTLVTNKDVFRYTQLMAHYKLNLETAVQSKAFLKGFRHLIPLEWMRLFSPQELQLLIGGDVQRIDVADLRRNVHYASGYHDSQPYIQTFWDIIESFTAEQQAAFLKFVTSCSRQPLLGFQHLHPKFSIQKVPAGSDDSRLPSSATCMNLLKLPQYANSSKLKEKLLYAITSNSGFELS